VRDIMEDTQPAPIRIKLITQMEDSFLDAAGRKRLADQLAPGAVAIIQKYLQVCIGVCVYARWPRTRAGSAHWGGTQELQLQRAAFQDWLCWMHRRLL
jgi:hypothetical protein